MLEDVSVSVLRPTLAHLIGESLRLPLAGRMVGMIRRLGQPLQSTRHVQHNKTSMRHQAKRQLCVRFFHTDGLPTVTPTWKDSKYDRKLSSPSPPRGALSGTSLQRECGMCVEVAVVRM